MGLSSVIPDWQRSSEGILMAMAELFKTLEDAGLSR